MGRERLVVGGLSELPCWYQARLGNNHRLRIGRSSSGGRAVLSPKLPPPDGEPGKAVTLGDQGSLEDHCGCRHPGHGAGLQLAKPGCGCHHSCVAPVGCDSGQERDGRYSIAWLWINWGGPQEYWLVKTGPDDKPGINGGILRHQNTIPKTVNTVEVSSIEEFIEKITRNGGSVAMPKMAIPGVGYQAYCLDTEGNLFGIHKPDPAAK